MPHLHKTWIKVTTLSLFTTIILFAAHSVSRADEITFNGVTSGCFGNPCTPTSPATLFGISSSNGSNIAQTPLTFTASSGFSGTSVNGVLDLNSPTNNLGFFSLRIDQAIDAGSDPIIYTGDFRLQITFSAPSNISGGPSPTFLAIVNGTVQRTPDDLVDIVFGDARLFTLSGNVSGSFLFEVSDIISLTPGSRVPLNGRITAAHQTAIPEPATLALLATGLTGLVGAARRRRKRKASSE